MNSLGSPSGNNSRPAKIFQKQMVEKLNKQIMGETVTNINLIFASHFKTLHARFNPFFVLENNGRFMIIRS